MSGGAHTLSGSTDKGWKSGTEPPGEGLSRLSRGGAGDTPRGGRDGRVPVPGGALEKGLQSSFTEY